MVMPEQALHRDQPVSLLSTFVPRYLREGVMGASAQPAVPSQEAGFGALLFIDISGFTAMTEGLAEQGPRGAELMSELLGRHYGRLVDLIHHGGGDVIAFAGDAVLAVWWAAEREGLGDAVAKAAGCALLIQQTASVEDTQQVRLSIGAGALSRYVLGGFAGRWHWLVSGPPFAQIRTLDAAGATGEISLSPEAARLLPDAGFDVTSPGVHRLRSLDRIASAPAQEPPAMLEHPDLTQAEDLDARLSGFTPEVVAVRLAAGQDGFLAEYRRVSVAFVKFEDLSDDASLEALQHNLTTVQQVLERYDGHLYQCLRDDKGFIVIIAFGVPPPDARPRPRA
jgi:class 3 adenylate cyclase